MAKKFRCSVTVRFGKSTFVCGQTPRDFRTFPRSVRTLRPKIKASPSEGGMRPVRMETVVLFPAPL